MAQRSQKVTHLLGQWLASYLRSFCLTWEGFHRFHYNYYNIFEIRQGLRYVHRLRSLQTVHLRQYLKKVDPRVVWAGNRGP